VRGRLFRGHALIGIFLVTIRMKWPVRLVKFFGRVGREADGFGLRRRPTPGPLTPSLTTTEICAARAIPGMPQRPNQQGFCRKKQCATLRETLLHLPDGILRSASSGRRLYFACCLQATLAAQHETSPWFAAQRLGPGAMATRLVCRSAL
jgi:hypothetical protein